MSVGLVCPRCNTLASLGATRCPVCEASLGVGEAPVAGSPNAPRAAARKGNGAGVLEEQMSTKACSNCGNQVPTDDRFCGKCGNRLEPTESGPGKTMFFAGVQMPGRAKLVLVKGDSNDGVAYQLNGTEHVLGRMEGAILFPEDPLISPRHANFMYRETKLYVRDEGSVNGVFTR